MTTTILKRTSSTFRRSCADLAKYLTRTRPDGTVLELAFTDRQDGDFHIDAEPVALAQRRHAVLAGDWSVVRQVHGADVVQANPGVSPEADGVFTAELEQPIAVQGADCAPIALVGELGPIGVVHAGWRGLAAGVVDVMVETLRNEGASVDTAIVGPLIGTDCYEFGADDLDQVARSLGEVVRGKTTAGTPALDLAAGIRASCSRAGIDTVRFVGGCTACTWDGFSHRARQESGRHALAARLTAGALR